MRENMVKQEEQTETVPLEQVGERHIVAVSIRGDRAKQLHEEMTRIIERDYLNHPGFFYPYNDPPVNFVSPATCGQRYWHFDPTSGDILGGNVFLGTLSDKVLARDGKSRRMTPLEGRQLDAKGKLRDNVGDLGVKRRFGLHTDEIQRDYGLVITSLRAGNEAEKPLIEDVKKRGLQLPLVVPYHALDLKVGNLVFSDDTTLLISGEEAIGVLKLFAGGKDNLPGIHRISRQVNPTPDWRADVYDIFSSSPYYRLDWVCEEK
jgi:hypothetical protein